MKIEELIDKIRGIQTIKSIQNTLNVSKEKAIYLVYRLRKRGFVQTKQDSDKMRIYHIAKQNALGGTSYIDVLNEYSPLKLASGEVYKIYGREPSIEETLVYAIKKREIRYIVACLALFRKIRNWSELYSLAKRNNLIREVGALYDVARLSISKVRRMDRRFEIHALPKKEDKYKYLIDNSQSKDFKNIQTKWKIHIPLRVADLEDYKR